MKRLCLATYAAVCFALFVASVGPAAAEMRKQDVRAAPGVKTVTLYVSKARDKVLRQVPAQQIAGVYDVDVSSSAAISIRLGNELVWLDTFDVILSDPGKAHVAKEECVVLSKGLKSDQSNMGLGTTDCAKPVGR
jgi:hypothetical protein